MRSLLRKTPVGCILVVLVFMTGCAGLNTHSTGFSSGTVLVTPPRNVVQNGQPHPAGSDSGERLQEIIIESFNSRSDMKAIPSRSDGLSHEEPVDIDLALKEAESRGADYVLIVELGEFLDAAPMTFRSDYVTLTEAKLLETSSGNTVWKLVERYRPTKTNLGSYYSLLENIGHAIVNDISAHI